MESFDNIIKIYEDIALSDSEVLKLLDGRCNIILYPDLYKYNSLDEILEPYGSCILLFAFQIKPSIYGHWCAINKISDNEVEFFNSYGGWPDDTLKHILGGIRKKSNQDKPYLSMLMLESPYQLSYNEYRFQKHGKNIKTCGRHCAIRSIFKDLSLEEYKKLLETLGKKLNMDMDELVTFLTIWINK